MSNPCFSICPKVCIIGDSTVLNHYYYLPQHRYARITSLAVSGETCVLQKARWEALSEAVRASFDYVVVQVGINDTDEVTILALYQDLINTIKGDISTSCKIIGCAMSPIRGGVVAEAYTRWLLLNDAIMQRINPIGNLNAWVESYNLIIGDVDGYLLPEYDDGTHFHPTLAGRNIVCQEIATVLV